MLNPFKVRDFVKKIVVKLQNNEFEPLTLFDKKGVYIHLKNINISCSFVSVLCSYLEQPSVRFNSNTPNTEKIKLTFFEKRLIKSFLSKIHKEYMIDCKNYKERKLKELCEDI